MTTNTFGFYKCHSWGKPLSCTDWDYKNDLTQCHKYDEKSDG